MKRRLIGLALAGMLFWNGTAAAHLCNDVFVQAKDNLAVKVDVRDGQLRIGKEASFRVYLLNTMDRDIVNIHLEVLSKEFEAEVKPAAEWDRFPYLAATRRGGKKVHFEVTLKRKAGVADGRYRIGLRLFNGKNRNMEFKTIDLGEAADVQALATSKEVAVDGEASRTEWGDAVLCADFHEYVKAGRYFENRPAADQGRFRITTDGESLCCLLGFQGGDDADADIATLYVADSPDATPRAIRIDRIAGSADGAPGVEVKPCANDRMLEVRIPLESLGLQPGQSFLANWTRTVREGGRETVSYWRGNTYSVENPMVYVRFAPEQL